MSRRNTAVAVGATPAALVALVRSEWGKAWSVRAPAACLAGAVLLAAATAFTLANDQVRAMQTGELPLGTPVGVPEVLASAVAFAQVVVVLAALQLVTPEYASGQIAITFLSHPRRWVVMLTKTAVAGALGALAGLLSGPLCVAATELVLGDAPRVTVPATEAAVVTAGAFACAAMIAVALGFLTRSGVAALSTAFVLLVLTLAAPAATGQVFPGVAGGALVSGTGDPYTRGVALLVLLAWVAASVGAAVVSVERRDA
ncbi:hypothetical protein M1843_05165 [Isoptericola sp. 4D.3]|uniref:ABC-2 type transport system permease protein n=1 Tax=Isoptericola peretonis TaxID=2918523 RepID=A0ABT0J0W6_9MICO|nr:hypothetical protein [Isoptericola sp. 4D.3]